MTHLRLKFLPLTIAAFLLLGCNDNQLAEKTTASAASVAASVGASASSTSSIGGSAANSEWLQVKEKEYGDSGVIVTLQAELKAVASEAQVQWLQVSGPAVALINPQQLRAQVVVPQVEQPTSLVFEITATHNGEIRTARQTIVALPLPLRASVNNPVVVLANQIVSAVLVDTQPIGTDFEVSIAGGTAIEGVDFVALPRLLKVLTGNKLEVPMQILPSARQDDSYTKVMMRPVNGGVPVVVTIVIPATVIRAVTEAASSQASSSVASSTMIEASSAEAISSSVVSVSSVNVSSASSETVVTLSSIQAESSSLATSSSSEVVSSSSEAVSSSSEVVSSSSEAVSSSSEVVSSSSEAVNSSSEVVSSSSEAVNSSSEVVSSSSEAVSSSSEAVSSSSEAVSSSSEAESSSSDVVSSSSEAESSSSLAVQWVTDAYFAMEGEVGAVQVEEAMGASVALVGSPTIAEQQVASGTSLAIDQSNYFIVPNVVLGDGDWTVEFWVSAAQFAANGYAIPLMQLGTLNEGAGGFGLSLFSNHSGIKQAYLRQSYSDLVGVTLPIDVNTPTHLAVVMHNGQARVVVNEGAWSAPILLSGNFALPQPLRVGLQNGEWLQSRPLFIDELIITAGQAKYLEPIASSSVASSSSEAESSSSEAESSSSEIVSSSSEAESSSSEVVSASSQIVSSSSEVVSSSSEAESSSSEVESSSSEVVSSSSEAESSSSEIVSSSSEAESSSSEVESSSSEVVSSSSEAESSSSEVVSSSSEVVSSSSEAESFSSEIVSSSSEAESSSSEAESSSSEVVSSSSEAESSSSEIVNSSSEAESSSSEVVSSSSEVESSSSEIVSSSSEAESFSSEVVSSSSEAQSSSSSAVAFDLSLSLTSFDISSVSAEFTLTHADGAEIDNAWLEIDEYPSNDNLAGQFVDNQLMQSLWFGLSSTHIVTFTASNQWDQFDSVSAMIYLGDKQNDTFNATGLINIFVGYGGQDVFVGNEYDNIYYFETGHGAVDIYTESTAKTNTVHLGRSFSAQTLRYLKHGDDLIIEGDNAEDRLTLVEIFENERELNVELYLFDGTRIDLNAVEIITELAAPQINLGFDVNQIENQESSFPSSIYLNVGVKAGDRPLVSVTQRFDDRAQKDILDLILDGTYGVFVGPDRVLQGNSTVVEYAATDDFGQSDTKTAYFYWGQDDKDIVSGAGDVNALFGGAGDDVLTGAMGNDILAGGQGDDQLDGNGGANVYVYNHGDGQDIIYGNKLGDSLLLGNIYPREVSVQRILEGDKQSLYLNMSPSDRIELVGQLSNTLSVNGVGKIVFADGTTWTDATLREMTLTGTFYDDLIEGFESDDQIQGRLGDDVLTGMGGVDTYHYYVGDGDDVVYGNQKEDILTLHYIDSTDVVVERVLVDGYESIRLVMDAECFNGSITLVGQLDSSAPFTGVSNIQFADDVVWASDTFAAMGKVCQGNVVPVNGHNYSDNLNGQFFDELMNGQEGDDVLNGMAGCDQLLGGLGNDRLSGGDDADILEGGLGSDTIMDGEGNDRIIFNLGDGQDSVDFVDDSLTSQDTLVLGKGITLDNIALQKIDNDLLLQIIDTRDSIYFYNWFKADVYQFDLVEIEGKPISRKEFLSKLAIQSNIIGTEKDDILTGYYGRDNIQGLAGDDAIFGGEGDDDIHGDTGDNQLYGEGGNDLLIGGAGNDYIDGGEGDDILIGYGGKDVLIGGPGDDKYYFGYDYGQDEVKQFDAIELNPNRSDSIVLLEGLSISSISLFKSGNNLLLSLKETNDTLQLTDWFKGIDYQVDYFEFRDAGNVKIFTREEFLKLVPIEGDGDVIIDGSNSAVVFSDNFNQEEGQANNAMLKNWNVIAGAVDVLPINGEYDYFNGKQGSFLDLNGSVGKPGAIETIQIFEAGTYLIEFSAAGSQRDGIHRIQLAMANFVMDTIILDTFAPLTHYRYEISLTKAGALSFTSLFGIDVGPLLDDVVVTQLGIVVH